MVCVPCQTGCNKCDEKNITKCLECISPLILLNDLCENDCPIGFKYNGVICEKIEEPKKAADLTLIYFPHIIGSILMMVLCIGGYFKD
jgi:hypothetical protein